MAKDSLGELIVSITTNVTELNKGLKDAKANVEKTSGEIIKTTEKVSKGLLAMGAVITGAFALMVKSSVDYSDQIFEVSQKTGIAVETLSKLKFVAEQTESSFEALATGFKFLNKNISEAVDGNKELQQAFLKVGITLQDDVTGEIITADKAFLKIADRFKSLNNDAQKTSLAMEIFGRSGSDLIPVLNLGSEGIQKLSDEAKRLGLVLSTDNAVAIDEFSDNMTAMKASLGGLWLQISTLIIPALNNFVTKIKDTIAQVRQWSEKNPQLSRTIAELVLGIGVLAAALGSLGLVIANVWKGLNTLFVILTTLNPAARVLAVAIASWTFGSFLAEIPLVKEGLSGPEGIFTKIFEFIDSPKIAKLKELATWFASLGLGVLGIKVKEPIIPAKPKQPVEPGTDENPIDLGRIDVFNTDPQPIYDLQLAWEGLDKFYNEMKQGMVMADTNQETESMMIFRQGMEERMQLIQTYNQLWMQAHQGMAAFANQFILTLNQGMSSALSSIIRGAMTAKEAFAQLRDQIIKMIVDFIAERAVAWTITQVLHSVIQGVQTSMAAATALAWAPAAAMVSLATFGANSAAAMAGMGTAVGFANALAAIPGAAEGANIISGGSVLIGERGPEILNLPAGAQVLPLNRSEGANGTSPINIFISDVKISSEIDIDDLAEQLGTNIQKKMRSR